MQKELKRQQKKLKRKDLKQNGKELVIEDPESKACKEGKRKKFLIF